MRQRDFAIGLVLATAAQSVRAQEPAKQHRIAGWVCYGIELNPAYVDVVVRRWQLFTGRDALHQASGEAFDERADRPHHDQFGAGHGEKTLCRE